MLCLLISFSPSSAGVKELEGTGRDRIREASFTVDCQKHAHIPESLTRDYSLRKAKQHELPSPICAPSHSSVPLPCMIHLGSPKSQLFPHMALLPTAIKQSDTSV